MQVTCPKCSATIEIAVTSFHPIRWGVSDFSNAQRACNEWRDPANAVNKANRICNTLDQAVISAVVPDDRGADR
jgi:hypothetical protein